MFHFVFSNNRKKLIYTMQIGWRMLCHKMFIRWVFIKIESLSLYMLIHLCLKTSNMYNRLMITQFSIQFSSSSYRNRKCNLNIKYIEMASMTGRLACCWTKMRLFIVIWFAIVSNENKQQHLNFNLQFTTTIELLF